MLADGLDRLRAVSVWIDALEMRGPTRKCAGILQVSERLFADIKDASRSAGFSESSHNVIVH